MNFDPLGYFIQRVDHLESRLRHLEETNQAVPRLRGRLEALEVWRTNWDRKLSKWPYAAWFAILIALNIAPEKTVETVLEILKGAL